MQGWTTVFHWMLNYKCEKFHGEKKLNFSEGNCVLTKLNKLYWQFFKQSDHQGFAAGVRMEDSTTSSSSKILSFASDQSMNNFEPVSLNISSLKGWRTKYIILTAISLYLRVLAILSGDQKHFFFERIFLYNYVFSGETSMIEIKPVTTKKHDIEERDQSLF